MINLTSAIQPALQNRLALIRTIFPLEVTHGSRLTSAMAAFALILLAACTQAGPLARTVRDAALLMRVLSRPDWRDTMSLPPQSIDQETIAPQGE